MKKIISILLTAMLLISAAYTASGTESAADGALLLTENTEASLMLTAEQSSSVLPSDESEAADRITDGGFENGLNGWSYTFCNPKPSLSEDDPNSGAKCLYLAGQKLAARFLSYNISVLQNTDYILEFYYKGTPNTATVSIAGSADIINTGIGAATETWTRVPLTFNSGNNTSLTLKFQIVKAYSYYIDDVSVVIKNEFIKNGSFVNGIGGWETESDGAFEVVTEDGGNHALRAYGGFYSSVYQEFTVSSDKSYELSFIYKGGSDVNIPMWYISSDGSFGSSSACAYGYISSADGWQRVSYVFKPTGTNLFIVFRSIEGAEWYADDVEIKETDSTAAQPVFDDGAPSEYDETFPIREGNFSYKYVPKTGTNIITEPGFENLNGQWNVGTFLNSAVKRSNEPQAVHSGDWGLIITAENTKQNALFEFTAQANTEYLVGLWIKSDGYDSENNLNRISWGIAGLNDGEFAGSRTISSNDGNWHLVEYAVGTSTQTNIAFRIEIENSTVYIDDMFVCKRSDIEKYISPSANKTAAALKSTSEQKATCAVSYNLFENYRFDEGDAFWEDTTGTVFGKQITVGDSGNSSYGNVLHYAVEKTALGAAYPKSAYYIKYVDVDPYTDYTFSVDYLPISLSDNGETVIADTSFGLLDSGSLYPSKITEINLSGCTVNGEWKTHTVQFNSGGHNKVGFFVFDGGGEMYFDNIYLFKNSLISNSGFDNQDWWASGWWYCTDGWWGYSQDTNTENGTNCLHIKDVWQGVHYGTSFDAQPNTNYEVTFIYKGNTKYSHVRILTESEEILADKNISGDVESSEWQSFTMKFNSGASDGKLIFAFVMENGADFYIDDVYIAVMPSNNITIVQGDGGKISLASTAAAPGENVNVTVTPNSGYRFTRLTVVGDTNSSVLGGGAVEGLESETNAYSFVMPGYDVVLSAEFAEKTNVISNGGFDNQDWWATGWWYCTDGWWGFSQETNAENGTSCLHIADVWQGVHYGTSFEAEPNTNYELTFVYKGNPKYSHARILTENEVIIAEKNIDGDVNAEEWQYFSCIFNSGNYDGYRIFTFVTEDGSDFYVDDVYITPLETNNIAVLDDRLTVSSASARSGDWVEVAAAPDSGKRVKNIALIGDENTHVINGNAVNGIETVSDSDVGFTMPGYDVLVTAEYTEYTDYNRDGVIDICDLVRLKKLIAADSGYANAAAELIALKKTLLGVN